MRKCSGRNCEKYIDAVTRFEVAYLRRLMRNHPTLRDAAKAAGMEYTRLWRKLRRYGFRPNAQRFVWSAGSPESAE